MMKIIFSCAFAIVVMACGHSEDVDKIVKLYNEAGIDVEKAVTVDEVQNIALETAGKMLEDVDPDVSISSKEESRIKDAVSEFEQKVNKKLNELGSAQVQKEIHHALSNAEDSIINPED